MHAVTKLVAALVVISAIGAIGWKATTEAAGKPGGALRDAQSELRSQDDARLLNTPDIDKLHRLIFTATLEGLYTDGVQNDVVDEILRADASKGHVPAGFSMHFVYVCPICMPAYDAFRVYRQRAELSLSRGKKRKKGEKALDTFGPGLPQAMRDRVLSDDFSTRCTALAELTRTWLDRKFRSMRLTESERSKWIEILRIGRKQGMGALLYQIVGRKLKQDDNVTEILATAKQNNQMTACPFCDGATCSLDPSLESVFFRVPAGKAKTDAKE